ncbi:hypothetical protein [Bradyrhizobium cenepequi]
MAAQNAILGSVAATEMGKTDSAVADHDHGTAEGLRPYVFAIVRLERSVLERLRE